MFQKCHTLKLFHLFHNTSNCICLQKISYKNRFVKIVHFWKSPSLWFSSFLQVNCLITNEFLWSSYKNVGKSRSLSFILLFPWSENKEHQHVRSCLLLSTLLQFHRHWRNNVWHMRNGPSREKYGNEKLSFKWAIFTSFPFTSSTTIRNIL